MTVNSQGEKDPGNGVDGAHESVIITTRDPNTPHNFGPASSLDKTLYTSERPGGDPGTEGAIIPASAVQDWIVFMKSEGITRVLILLDNNELECYDSPGLIQRYRDAGLTVHHRPLNESGSVAAIRSAVESAESSEERVVAHCTHGMGRSGRVAAGWLVMRHGLTPEVATKVAIETAKERGMERMGNVPALKKWLGDHP